MKALRITKFGEGGLKYGDVPDPVPAEGMALVRVSAASIAPSDAKNAEGKMEGTFLPRIPGRDYSGVVLDGPSEWVGAEVWGTGGEIGYTVDGSHAELLAVPVTSLCRKPSLLSMQQAAVVGINYLVAWIGLIEYARIEPGDTLVVMGSGGGVGSAVVQIGLWRGAQVIGVDRHDPAPAIVARLHGFLRSDQHDFEAALAKAAGPGADVVFDTVGGPMFEPSLGTLGHRGRLVEISAPAPDRRVTFDLIDFYHKEARILGVDTRKRDASASADLLRRITPQFENGSFVAPEIERVVALADGVEAYAQEARGELRGRVVLTPGAK